MQALEPVMAYASKSSRKEPVIKGLCEQDLAQSSVMAKFVWVCEFRLQGT